MTQIVRMFFTNFIFRSVQVASKMMQFFNQYFVFCAIILSCIIPLILINWYISHYFTKVSSSNAPTSIEQEDKNAKATYVTEEVIINKGDTIGAILTRQGLKLQERNQLIKLAKKQNITSRLQIGRKIIFYYTQQQNIESNNQTLVFSKMSLQMGRNKSMDFVRNQDSYEVHMIDTPLTKSIVQYTTSIDSSVMESLGKIGVSSNNIIEVINAYSHTIDFQRQIMSGDHITILIEKFYTHDNIFSHYGQVVYASLDTGGKKHNIYRFAHKNISSQFFAENGHAIKSNLLTTPVKIGYISSRFGYRKKHPVLGYGKMHNGVDFAAPTGTPIYAAGNGIIKFIGWKSGYGRFIVIQHNKKLSTAYAHASRFAKNLKKGSKVKQNDVIAFVGRTGRTTGAHLHYEVRINNKHVNPMKFKSSPKIILSGKAKVAFEKYRSELHNLKST